MPLILDKPTRIIITCGPGIAPVLSEEVKDLGFPILQTKRLSVETKGNLDDTIKLNLYLRTATRVLLSLVDFKAKNTDELYRTIKRFSWENILYANGYFHVESSVDNRTIKDSRFPNLIVKDAIADRFIEKLGKRPDAGGSREQANFFLYWKNTDCQLYIDSTGETIAKHGYRTNPWKAPLQESLAAAIVLSTRWQMDIPFVNPMCGSSTLAIEAALIALNKYPAMERNNFGFMHIKGFSTSRWKNLLTQAQNNVNKSYSGKIIASDRSGQAIKAARANAEKAGVSDYINFEHADFKQTSIPNTPGVIILNPGYGKRMGDIQSLEETYREIGDFFKKKCAGYYGYLFTGNLELTKCIGLRSKRKIPFYTGKIEARLLEFEMYAGKK